MTSATTTARPPAQDMDDAVDAAIEQAARILHLPAIRDGYEEAVAHALRERSTYKQFLAGILGEEVADRDQSAGTAAHLPVGTTPRARAGKPASTWTWGYG